MWLVAQLPVFFFFFSSFLFLLLLLLLSSSLLFSCACVYLVYDSHNKYILHRIPAVDVILLVRAVLRSVPLLDWIVLVMGERRTKFLNDDWMLERQFVDEQENTSEKSSWSVLISCINNSISLHKIYLDYSQYAANNNKSFL